MLAKKQQKIIFDYIFAVVIPITPLGYAAEQLGNLFYGESTTPCNYNSCIYNYSEIMNIILTMDF